MRDREKVITNRLYETRSAFRICRYFGWMATLVGETRHRLTLETTLGTLKQQQSHRHNGNDLLEDDPI